MSTSLLEPRPELYVLVGSQFCIKANAALQYLNVSYKTIRVNPRKLKETLPKGTVPAMKLADGTWLHESNDIIRHFDKSSVLFPTNESESLEKHIADIFNMYVLFFNWVDQDGYNRTIREAAKKSLPSPCLVFLVDRVLNEKRELVRTKIRSNLSPSVSGNFDDAAFMLAELNKELAAFETKLEAQDWLCGTQPTAADFMLWGCLNHLIDWSGGHLPPVDPTLLNKYPKLTAWFERVKTNYPVKYMY